MDHLAHNGPRQPFEKVNPGSRLPLSGGGRSKPLRRAGGVGDGGAQAEANNLAVIGPVQMYGMGGMEDGVGGGGQEAAAARASLSDIV